MFRFFPILLLICQLSSAQSIDTITLIHDTLPEISGMTVSSSGTIWGHNDSGDDPLLHEMDTNGNLLRSVWIAEAVNVDWEDMCKDDQGNYFIGDFGNNLNRRKDLTIYKIPSPEINNDDTLFADSVVFTFRDQTAFPPPFNEWNFDCESIISYGDSLYVFSKNWSTSPITTMYRIYDTIGTYKSDIGGTFNTGGFITAAALSPNKKTMVLLSQDYFWVFYDFTGSDFFGGEAKKFEYEETQKEACAFANDSILYFSDEKSSVNYLYSINLSELLDTATSTVGLKDSENRLEISFNSGLLRVEGLQEPSLIRLIDLSGKLILQTSSQSESEIISSGQLSSGIYLVEVRGARFYETQKVGVMEFY